MPSFCGSPQLSEAYYLQLEHARAERERAAERAVERERTERAITENAMERERLQRADAQQRFAVLVLGGAIVVAAIVARMK